jgi:hypothetical protein
VRILNTKEQWLSPERDNINIDFLGSEVKKKAPAYWLCGKGRRKQELSFSCISHPTHIYPYKEAILR